MVQELAKKLVAEPADYKKSIFKHQPTKIQLFGKKVSLAELRADEEKAKSDFEIRQRKIEKEKMRATEKRRLENEECKFEVLST